MRRPPFVSVRLPVVADHQPRQNAAEPAHQDSAVIVIGGGITGLATAWALHRAGRSVLVFESTGRVGGQIRTERLPAALGGGLVDVGAESIHLGTPQLARLVGELGLRDSVVGAEPGASRLVTARGLRPLPAGIAPTGPTRLWPVLRSGILSPAGLARAGLEPLTARRRFARDVSVGEFVRARFGDEVAETFVDPLLGNLHAGDIDRLSLSSVAPQLAPAAATRRSLVLRRRRPGGTPGPLFASWPDGLSRFPSALAEGLPAGTVRTGTPVRGLRRGGDGWTVLTDAGESPAGEVVLAVPGAVAAALLEPEFPGLGAELTAGRTADVATIVLAYPRAAAEGRLAGNGVLLRTDSGRVLKAATWLSRKWARLRDPELFLVRASAGRAGVDELSGFDDAGLAGRIHRDLAEVTGLAAEPVGSLVTRWPGAFPQLEVGHAARMAAVRARLAGSGLHLAGAAVDGLGLSATVRSALAAAEAISTA